MTLSPAIDFSTVIGLSVGALIAGLVGVSATLLENRLSRREEHRKKLMDNLTNIQSLLKAVMYAVWPPLQIGYESLRLPLPWSMVPEDRIVVSEQDAVDVLSHYKITDSVLLILTPAINGNESIRIRRELFHDMNNHFPELYSQMLEWEETVRNAGSDLRLKFYSVVSTIYHELIKRGLVVSTDKPATASPLEITNNPALAIQVMFNLVLGIPTAKWFNTYHQIYLTSPDRDKMNDIVKSLAFQFDIDGLMPEIESMLQKRDRLWSAMDAITVSDRRLKGLCRLS